MSEDEEFRPGLGSLDYMAPERLADVSATRAAHLYSFGVLLHEMVTGWLPFDTGTPVDERGTLPTAARNIRLVWRAGGTERSSDASIRLGRFQRATEAVDALRPAPYGESPTVTGSVWRAGLPGQSRLESGRNC